MSETAVGIVGAVVVLLYGIHRGARIRWWSKDGGIDIDPRDRNDDE